MIPYNTVPDLPFRRPSLERAVALARELHSKGVLTKLRNSAGQDVDAGCGQLRARSQPVRMHRRCLAHHSFLPPRGRSGRSSRSPCRPAHREGRPHRASAAPGPRRPAHPWVHSAASAWRAWRSPGGGIRQHRRYGRGCHLAFAPSRRRTIPSSRPRAGLIGDSSAVPPCLISEAISRRHHVHPLRSQRARRRRHRWQRRHRARHGARVAGIRREGRDLGLQPRQDGSRPDAARDGVRRCIARPRVRVRCGRGVAGGNGLRRICRGAGPRPCLLRQRGHLEQGHRF